MASTVFESPHFAFGVPDPGFVFQDPCLIFSGADSSFRSDKWLVPFGLDPPSAPASELSWEGYRFLRLRAPLRDHHLCRNGCQHSLWMKRYSVIRFIGLHVFQRKPVDGADHRLQHIVRGLIFSRTTKVIDPPV